MYSEEDCQNHFEGAEYRLDGTTVIASMNIKGEEIEMWISLDEFDMDMMKIFG